MQCAGGLEEEGHLPGGTFPGTCWTWRTPASSASPCPRSTGPAWVGGDSPARQADGFPEKPSSMASFRTRLNEHSKTCKECTFRREFHFCSTLCSRRSSASGPLCTLYSTTTYMNAAVRVLLLGRLTPSGLPGPDGVMDFVVGSWVGLVGDEVASLGRRRLILLNLVVTTQ